MAKENINTDYDPVQDRGTNKDALYALVTADLKTIDDNDRRHFATGAVFDALHNFYEATKRS